MKRTALSRKTPMQRRRFTASAVGKDRARREKHLDALCRKLVVELRDRNTCQRCGTEKVREDAQIHWAHIFTRNHKRLRWNPDNSLALCAGCHLWMDREKRDGYLWFARKFPDRAMGLGLLRRDRSRKPKMDLATERLWLENAIREWESQMTDHRSRRGRDDAASE